MVGWFGRGPRGICEKEDAMWGRNLEGIEVHLCSLWPIGCEGNYLVESGRHRKGICGALDPCRHRDILPTFGGLASAHVSIDDDRYDVAE